MEPTMQQNKDETILIHYNRQCLWSMDCVGQPGLDSEFYTDFKSGFSFFVGLIPISAESSKVLRLFLNIATKRSNCEALQSQVFGSFSKVETWPLKLSRWVKLFHGGTEKNVNILKTAKKFQRLDGNRDQFYRKTKTRFEISVKFWIYPWLSNAIHWPQTLSRVRWLDHRVCRISSLNQ